MPDFKDENAYQPKGDTFFDDGREIRLLHHIFAHPDLPHIRNHPPAVLSAIDAYARSTAYLMNVGADKGRIVTSLIQQHKPKTMVELGGYIGYSCILFGAAVRDAARGTGYEGTARYYSLERNPEFAAVSMVLVELAGLSDVVKIVVGASDESLRRLKAGGVFEKGKDGKEQIDLMFLDHYKPAYKTDLQLCEELGLIKAGTTLAGDNCVTPGNPPYLEYVRASCEEKKRMLERATQEQGKNGDGGWDERMDERSRKQYAHREGEGQKDVSIRGNPEIVYESEMVDSFEPTGEKDGVEITKCVRVG